MARSKQRWKELCWDLQSKQIRKEAANFQDYAPCYTCQKMFNWKELQAGHYHHGKLDFDRRNIKPQCRRCNKWLHGNLTVYGIRLLEELGMDEFKNLYREANTHKGYGIKELKEIYATLHRR